LRHNEGREHGDRHPQAQPQLRHAGAELDGQIEWHERFPYYLFAET
jgi:hypothetical protein